MGPKCPQFGRFDSLEAPSRSRGFTLIELLTVIAIIMMLVALALPNFVAMMKGRRWSGAMQNIQFMVMRARAMATNSRTDMSVEFDTQGDNGTTLWLESESNAVEKVENLNDLAWMLGNNLNTQDAVNAGHNAVLYLTSADPPGPWYAAGGRDLRPNPLPPDPATHYYGDLVYPPSPGAGLPDAAHYGDNARQSEVVTLGTTITVEPDAMLSPNFINYDASVGPSQPYGKDNYRDIRIGFAGALVQSLEPVIYLNEIRGKERFRVTVVRCTGRLIAVK